MYLLRKKFLLHYTRSYPWGGSKRRRLSTAATKPDPDGETLRVRGKGCRERIV